MSDDFRKIDANTAASAKGFAVEVKLAGGVEYRGSAGNVTIDTEWLVDPPRILVYRNINVEANPRIDEVYSDAKRALEFLGHRVAFWAIE